MRSCLMIWIL